MIFNTIFYPPNTANMHDLTSDLFSQILQWGQIYKIPVYFVIVHWKKHQVFWIFKTQVPAKTKPKKKS